MVLKNLQAKEKHLRFLIEVKGMECGEWDSLFATVEFMIFEGRYDLADKVLDMINADLIAKCKAN